MSPPIRVLFGTETGNAEGCAEELVEDLSKLGLSVELTDMDDYEHESVSDEDVVLIVTSTFGNGDPPYNAFTFMELLKGPDAPSIEGVRFSVCGLGDKSYPNFAQCGRDFDERLGALGGERIVPRMDCDVDFEVPFDQWKQQVLAWARENLDISQAAPPPAAKPSAKSGGLWGKVSGWFGGKKAAPVQASSAAPAGVAVDAATGPPSRDRPFLARVSQSRLLSREGSAKETRHYEIDLTGSGIAFQGGDSFGVLPQNPPAEVEGILAQLGLDPEASVQVKGRTLALRGALARRLCLQSVSVDLLRELAKREGPGQEALQDGGPAIKAYLAERYLLDVLRDHPSASLSAQALVDKLKPLPPRLYSVASSPLVDRDKVAFLVETLRYERAGRPCEGVASVWMADRLDEGGEIPLYLAANPDFHLPSDEVDILMFGPGTGLAPFRAFLQERDARDASGRSWLFFGHQHESTDFLYREELLAWLERGRLARLDLAWSRDQDHKVYVQHKLLEAGAEAWRWIEGGAHLYVCGDAKGMAPGVHEALLQVAREHGGLDAAAAQAWLRGLEEQGRYHRDVY
ncbi:MAG: sulfite reductase [NADPH] flavoprotein alpha-component [Deltaproteobacteria bacterium]|nr:MAG: sulfite reductase [NADPH] flavoprotein alpha-component [Deltaproteobacteria bacterium]